MHDVIEHLKNPNETLKIISSLIKKGGMLVIKAPIDRNALPFKLDKSYLQILKKIRTFNKPPYHLYDFSPKTIILMVKNIGFKIFKMEIFPSHPCKRLMPIDASKLEIIVLRIILYLNYFLTTCFGIYGHRITLYAKKP